MKKLSLLFSLTLVLFFNTNLRAQDHVVDINLLTNETQIMSNDPDHMRLVWYIPIDYWEAVFAQDPTISDEDAQAVLDALGIYEIFAVVDGKVGAFGNVNYKPKSEIRSSIKLIGVNNKNSVPLDQSELTGDARSMLAVFGPVLSNMMGELGSNMHFFIFNAKKDGKRIAAPTGEGNMTMTVGGEDFKFEFPFGSLLPMKVCPVDGKEMNGAWNYCPTHGNPLQKKN